MWKYDYDNYYPLIVLVILVIILAIQITMMNNYDGP